MLKYSYSQIARLSIFVYTILGIALAQAEEEADVESEDEVIEEEEPVGTDEPVSCFCSLLTLRMSAMDELLADD